MYYIVKKIHSRCGPLDHKLGTTVLRCNNYRNINNCNSFSRCRHHDERARA